MKSQRVQVSWMKEEIKIVPTLLSLRRAVTTSSGQSLGEGNTNHFRVKTFIYLYCNVHVHCTSPFRAAKLLQLQAPNVNRQILIP